MIKHSRIFIVLAVICNLICFQQVFAGKGQKPYKTHAQSGNKTYTFHDGRHERTDDHGTQTAVIHHADGRTESTPYGASMKNHKNTAHPPAHH